MALLFRMALRNLRRHLRRSLITMVSISVGLAIVLWLQCILAGRNENVITKITTTYTGNLQIYRDGYLKDHLTTQVFGPLPDGWQAKLPAGSLYSPRLHFPGLLSSGENSAPVSLEGVAPDFEDKITSLRANLHEGEYLSPKADIDCAEKQIYIGSTLADLLNVKVGNKLVFLAQAPDGTLANELFRVTGTFDSRSPEFDKRFAYAPLTCVKALGNFAGLHEIAIRLPSSDNEQEIRQNLQSFLPNTVMVSSWREALPSVASLIKFNEAVLVMISVILMSVLVLGVANTLDECF
jgi:putative ABC transport system permease protein